MARFSNGQGVVLSCLVGVLSYREAVLAYREEGLSYPVVGLPSCLQEEDRPSSYQGVQAYGAWVVPQPPALHVPTIIIATVSYSEVPRSEMAI